MTPGNLAGILTPIFFWKIVKTVATRCQILRLKCAKFDFGRGCTPYPAGGAYNAPLDSLAGFNGASSKCGPHDFDSFLTKNCSHASLQLLTALC